MVLIFNIIIGFRA